MQDSNKRQSPGAQGIHKHILPDWGSLQKAILHRLTILFFFGPIAMVVILFAGVSLEIDPLATFNKGLFITFLLVVNSWSIFCNYQLITRKWSVEKWAMTSMYSGVLHTFLFAAACASTGRLWPAGAIIYFMAIIAYLGYLRIQESIFFIGAFASAFFIKQYYFHPALYDRDFYYNLCMLAGCGIALFWMGLGSSYYKQQEATIRGLLRSSRKDKRIIAEERQKSDNLLLSILPASIAGELKATGQTHPVRYKLASVLFTDFKGFTRIAERLSPEDLVGELDKCFSYFDSLMDRYKLEKLKTIGDSYMCAGGIPEPNNTHAVDCVLAAIEIQSFMKQMAEIKESQKLDYWELRLGIHTGSLIAGVIGEKKFAYDVWSDTVNTASRCESAGAPGKINISGVTKNLVQDFFACTYRGQIASKNKDPLDMYFVEGILPELSLDGAGKVPNEKFNQLYAKLDKSPASAR